MSGIAKVSGITFSLNLHNMREEDGMSSKSQVRAVEGSLALVLAALCWGFAFVFSVKGSETMSFWFFNAVRFTLASISLLPFAVWSFIHNHRLGPGRHEIAEKRFSLLERAKRPSGSRRNRILVFSLSDLRKPGTLLNRILIYILCGIFLFLASSVQQLGLEISKQAAHAGFIASLYIVVVPILARIFLRKRTSFVTVSGIFLAIIGFYFLSIPVHGGFSSINPADLIYLISATLFAAHIILIDANVHRVDTMVLSFVQSAIVALLSWIAAAVDGSINMAAAWNGWMSVFYTGVISVGVAYTLQIFGQLYVPPAQASILMSLESLFSALGGVLILHETMSSRAIFGSSLIFLGTLVSQIPIENIRLRINRRHTLEMESLASQQPKPNLKTGSSDDQQEND